MNEFWIQNKRKFTTGLRTKKIVKLSRNQSIKIKLNRPQKDWFSSTFHSKFGVFITYNVKSHVG